MAHGKSTVVKAISGVQTVRFKNELERNITIKLGYANAKIYKCANVACERPGCYRAHSSGKEDSPPCDLCGHSMDLVRRRCPSFAVIVCLWLCFSGWVAWLCGLAVNAGSHVKACWPACGLRGIAMDRGGSCG